MTTTQLLTILDAACKTTQYIATDAGVYYSNKRRAREFWYAVQEKLREIDIYAERGDPPADLVNAVKERHDSASYLGD